MVRRLCMPAAPKPEASQVAQPDRRVPQAHPPNVNKCRAADNSHSIRIAPYRQTTFAQECRVLAIKSGKFLRLDGLAGY